MIRVLQGLTTRQRTTRSNRLLGAVLAFIAGAVNAGGFLAVRRYTSHMSGIISAIADDLVLGNLTMVVGGITMVAAFLSGAICCTLLINWARRRRMQGEYALPLMLEALLLLLFGLLGAHLHSISDIFVPTTVLVLCFIMGLQNAMITKISRAEIRTTHMTGIVTDLGIELGRLFFRSHSPALDLVHQVRADRERLRIHAAMLGAFLGGAVVGAQAFRIVGFRATIPIAAFLMAIAARPLILDARHFSNNA